MKLNKNTLFNAVTDMTDKLNVKPYPVHGFSFEYPDLLTHFNPLTQEASTIAGFPRKKGMPEIKGFFYPSKEYLDYLTTIQDHPANINNLPLITDLSMDDFLTM